MWDHFYTAFFYGVRRSGAFGYGNYLYGMYASLTWCYELDFGSVTVCMFFSHWYYVQENHFSGALFYADRLAQSLEEPWALDYLGLCLRP